MKRMSRLVAFSVSLLALPALASAGCREDFFTVQDFSFRDAGEEKIEIAFTLQSSAAKAIRMIDADFGFRDALGGRIGAVDLARDVAIPEGGVYSQTALQGTKSFERLLKVDRADIAPFTCVRGVVYDDGSKEEF